MRKSCNVEGCNRPYKAHGYCNTHYEQIRRHGKLLEPPVRNRDKTCKVEDCTNHVQTLGYCNKHYQQYLKYGKIIEPQEAKPPPDKDWLNQKYNEELLDVEEIAQLCDRPKWDILKYLNRYKIGLTHVEPELRSRVLYKTKKIHNIKSMKDYLYDEYIINNKSSIDIGNALGIDCRIIIEWLRQLNIKIRGNSEKIQTRNAQNILPTDMQWQIILGSWLGDGNIRMGKGAKNAGFRITHCEKQYDYLQYKRSILEENGLMWFNECKRESLTSTNNISIRFGIESQRTPLLNEIYEKCYTYGKAIFNVEYLYQLTAFGLYIWYLDDGCLQHKRSIVLCTDNFTYDDHKEMQLYFKTQYDIDAIIFSIKNQRYYRLRFNKTDTLKFLNIIKEYKNNVECMKYKFL